MLASAISRRVLVAAALLSATPALAQSDPASLERTIPKLEPRTEVRQSRVATPDVPAEASARISGRFVLGAVNIEGATVFSSEQLAQSFEPFLASEIGQAELEKIAAGITARYRQAGYLLSYAVIPEQSVRSGIVTVRVVEGYVDEVRFQGTGGSAGMAERIAARLGAQRPLRSETLERSMGLMRDIPGLVVTDTQISRSAGNPARHRLTIILGSDRVRALAYADNRGTIDGARMRGYSSVNFAPLAVPGDQLQLDLFAIPSDDFRFSYGQLKWSLPLGSNGLRLSAAASRGYQFQRLEGPNQHGKSTQVALDLAYPLRKSRSLGIVGHISLGHLASREERADTTIQRDRLQVARAWLEFVRAAKIRLDGRIGISRGLDLGAATERGDPLASRPGAGARFMKVNAEFQLIASLSEKIYARLDSAAQFSTRPLLAPEEFAIGGSRIGRAQCRRPDLPGRLRGVPRGRRRAAVRQPSIAGAEQQFAQRRA